MITILLILAAAVAVFLVLKANSRSSHGLPPGYGPTGTPTVAGAPASAAAVSPTCKPWYRTWWCPWMWFVLPIWPWMWNWQSLGRFFRSLAWGLLSLAALIVVCAFLYFISGGAYKVYTVCGGWFFNRPVPRVITTVVPATANGVVIPGHQMVEVPLTVQNAPPGVLRGVLKTTTSDGTISHYNQDTVVSHRGTRFEASFRDARGKPIVYTGIKLLNTDTYRGTWSWEAAGQDGEFEIAPDDSTLAKWHGTSSRLHGAPAQSVRVEIALAIDRTKIP